MNAKERAFIKQVWDHYKRHGRRLPWRETTDPYAILVSEFMLQQTQVPRVLEKYPPFIEQFPTVGHLARAHQRTVLRYWQGLGYNRRARHLKRAAEHIYRNERGAFPRSFEALTRLPGVGPSTAGGVCAFAFDQPHPFIETNIRRAYIYHFFPHASHVSDEDIRPLVMRTMDTEHPREWFWALMDYGAQLPRLTNYNPNTQSRHYKKQSPFRGSDREIRGAILRALTRKQTLSGKELARHIEKQHDRTITQAEALVSEGMLRKKNGHYMIA